jgi:hypothetical protein
MFVLCILPATACYCLLLPATACYCLLLLYLLFVFYVPRFLLRTSVTSFVSWYFLRATHTHTHIGVRRADCRHAARVLWGPRHPQVHAAQPLLHRRQRPQPAAAGPAPHLPGGPRAGVQRILRLQAAAAGPGLRGDGAEELRAPQRALQAVRLRPGLT